MNKIYEYQGFKIQNSPYGSEARWFIFDKNMERIKYISPCKTLKDAKMEVDVINKNK